MTCPVEQQIITSNALDDKKLGVAGEAFPPTQEVTSDDNPCFSTHLLTGMEVAEA